MILQHSHLEAVRVVRGRRRRNERVRVGEVALRLDYLGSIAWTTVAAPILMLIPAVGQLLSPYLFLTAVPFLLAQASDLRRAGHRAGDVVWVQALNLVLIPVNLAGVLKSLQQAATRRKIPFARTPKIADRVAAPALFVVLPYALAVALALLAWRAAVEGYWLGLVFAAFSCVLALVGSMTFVGVREAAQDVAAALVYVPAPKPVLESAAAEPRFRNRFPNRWPRRCPPFSRRADRSLSTERGAPAASLSSRRYSSTFAASLVLRQVVSVEMGNGQMIDAVIGMTPTGRRSFSLEFRIEFLRQWDQCFAHGDNVRLMREHGLARDTVARWLVAMWAAVPSEPSAGSTSCPATGASNATASCWASSRIATLQRREERCRINDQTRDELVTSRRVVPGDVGLARLAIVMTRKPGHDRRHGVEDAMRTLRRGIRRRQYVNTDG